MSWTDSNSFEGKVFLNVIDKLILGLAAGVVLFLFQQCERAKDEAFQERLAISQIETKIISDGIASANKHMLDYLTIAEPAAQNNVKLDPAPSTEVSRLRDQIRLTLLIVQEMTPSAAIKSSVGKAADDLLTAIAALNRLLRQTGDASAANTRQAQLNVVNEAYRTMLGALRTAAVAAAETTRLEAAE